MTNKIRHPEKVNKPINPIKIEENYSGPTIHITDASRSVGAVGKLLNENEKIQYEQSVREEFENIRNTVDKKKIKKE